MADKSLILDKATIEQKLMRIAYQIMENNYDEDEIYLIGIKDGGYTIAKKLKKIINKVNDLGVNLHHLELDKINPVDHDITFSFAEDELKGKAVILVDDVANTGKTLAYALKPLIVHTPKKIQVAVLVDRKHKSFPITADFVGLKLSTTLQEHIIFDFTDTQAVYLS